MSCPTCGDYPELCPDPYHVLPPWTEEEITNLKQYSFLLERGLSSPEARETIWPQEEVVGDA